MVSIVRVRATGIDRLISGGRAAWAWFSDAQCWGQFERWVLSRGFGGRQGERRRVHGEMLFKVPLAAPVAVPYPLRPGDEASHIPLTILLLMQACGHTAPEQLRAPQPFLGDRPPRAPVRRQSHVL